jgi:hypothetical protein
MERGRFDEGDYYNYGGGGGETSIWLAVILILTLSVWAGWWRYRDHDGSIKEGLGMFAFVAIGLSSPFLLALAFGGFIMLISAVI